MVDTFSMPDILDEVVVYGLMDLVTKGADVLRQDGLTIGNSLCCFMSFVDMGHSFPGSNVPYIDLSKQTPRTPNPVQGRNGGGFLVGHKFIQTPHRMATVM